MAHRVCPWWLGRLLANPLRRLGQDPRTILEPYVSEGMTVLEPGPGVGFFTIELARLVGSTGRVVAVDIQERMLDGLRKRARKRGVLDRIEPRRATAEGLEVGDLAGRVDFVLAFAVVHEVADALRFFDEVGEALKRSGALLLAEPRGHVKEPDFLRFLRAAEHVGLVPDGAPRIARSRSALLRRA